MEFFEFVGTLVQNPETTIKIVTAITKIIIK